MSELLSEPQRKLILTALDAGAKKTADYLSKLCQEPWKCMASFIYHDFKTPLFSSFPESDKAYLSAYLPLQDGIPLGVHMIISPESVKALSKAWAKIYQEAGSPPDFSAKDMVREISNIVAHGFCGELGDLFSTLLILSVPEVTEGTRRSLIEREFEKVGGADLVVISNVVMSKSDLTVRCELYFYAAAEMLGLLLRKADRIEDHS